jgi:antitoxin HigA-1
MPPSHWTICVFHRETDWKSWLVIVAGNTVFALTTNGVFVSAGRIAMPWTSKSLITIGFTMSRPKKLPPIHPGEVLQEEFLAPLGISQYRLAKDTSVPPRRINEIVRGQRSISTDTALRLSRYFGTSERFWTNLQTRYDLEIEKDRLGTRLDREVHARPKSGRHVS